MNLTQERLIELGWIIDNYNGFSFMRNNNLVLVPMAGVWTLGRLIFGEPHIPLGRPVYIFTEDQYVSVMNDIIQ